MKTALGFILCCLVAWAQSANILKPNNGVEWAVLVAGSIGYTNYRHQADVCHAYQILHARGIPDERIIVMMFDDVANHDKNPYPGKLFNRPGGPDVYQGVPKDYVRFNVTPTNFLSVLLGEEEKLKGKGSGKVLKSGPEDRVFINLVDHGADGIFCFPFSDLKASDLVNTLKTLHERNAYKELIIYTEACESGSLYKDLLPDDINVYSVTASDPYHSSFAYYYDDAVGAYVGDLFSISWMEDTDKLKKDETFENQFKEVYERVIFEEEENKYGDLSLQKHLIWDFFGSKGVENTTQLVKYDNIRAKAVDSRDVPVYTLQNQINSVKSLDRKLALLEDLSKLLNDRRYVEGVFENVVLRITENVDTMREVMSEKSPNNERECYENTVDEIHSHCFNLGQNPFALKFLRSFSNLCNRGYSHRQMKDAIVKACEGVQNLKVE